MPKKIPSVLHAFNKYLPITENWAHKIIEATPRFEKHIFGFTFEKNNFYNPDWKFIDFNIGALDLIYCNLGKTFKDIIIKMLFRLLIPEFKKRNLKKLNQYCTTYEIDILHSHFGSFSTQLIKAIPGSGVKHVVSFYGGDYEQIPYNYPKFIMFYEQLFMKASAFLCEGKHGASTLLKMGCPDNKIHIVHLGLNIKKIPFHKRVKLKFQLNLIQIATMTEKKGYYYTIRAFAEAIKTCPNMTLTIVGSPKSPKDTKIFEDIKNIIKINSIENHVFLIPRIDFQSLHYFLLDYHVFIHPSCYAKDMDCEGGAPVVLLDCQATGMPVISTKHCDIPEEVLDGITGLLFEERNVEGLIQGIKMFYKMEQLEYQNFSIKAREHVKVNYDISRSGKQLMEIYNSIL